MPSGRAYNTAKDAVATLTALGILVPEQRIRGAQFWIAEELMRQVYED
jgi:hypothetical protein